MKYLGIDYGTKRVGIATSDDGGTMAFPYRVVPNTKTLVADIVAICQSEGVGSLVVGDSRNNNNEPNPIMALVHPFAEELRKATDLPLVFVNEAFSSREAMHIQGDNMHNDASAAAIVLQSHLDRINPSLYDDGGEEIVWYPGSTTGLIAQHMASIEEFHAIEMKVGTILVAEYIEGADKLLRLEVDFGPKAKQEGEPIDAATEMAATEDTAAEEERDIRQILSGIRAYYEPTDLIGKQCPFVVNLPTRTMRGLESHGMILAVGTSDGVALLHPDKEVPPGSELR